MKSPSAFSMAVAVVALSLAALSIARAQTIVVSASGTARTSATIDGAVVTAGTTPVSVSYTFDQADVSLLVPGDPGLAGYYRVDNALVGFSFGVDGTADFRSFAGGVVGFLDLRIINDLVYPGGPFDLIHISGGLADVNTSFIVSFQQPASAFSDDSLGSFISFLNGGSWTPTGGNMFADTYAYFYGEVGSPIQADITSASASAIPEPSTYAALAGVATLSLAAFLRRRTLA